MVIGGEAVAAANGSVIEVINPATGDIIDTVPDDKGGRGESGSHRQRGAETWAEILSTREPLS